MTLVSLPDLIAAPFWLAANVLLAVAAWRVGGRCFPRDDVLARLLHTLLLAWGAIVLAAFLLSTVRCLYPPLLLAVIAIASAAVIYRCGPVSPAVRPANKPWHVVWLAGGCLAVTSVVPCALLEFPRDWDSLAYHIPFIDQWLRARTLNNTNSSSWFHPGNNELLGMWFVGPFSGDFLIGLNNIPAVAVLGLGTREMGRRLGLRRVPAHLAGLAAVTPYVVTRQLLDSENDVAVAAMFVTALAYGLRAAFVPRRPALFYWAIGLGLLPGIKYYALGYAAVVGLGVTALALWLRGMRPALKMAAAGLLGTALFSGYWYARNALLTGTPIFPQGLFGSRNVMAETFPTLQQTTLWNHREAGDVLLLVTAAWRWLGAAHCLAFLLSQITVVFVAIGSFSQRGDRVRGGQLLLACLIVACIAIFAKTPFVVETIPGTRNSLIRGYLPARFLLATCSILVLALVILIQSLSTHMASRQKRAALTWRPKLVAATARHGLYALFGALALCQFCAGRNIPSFGDQVMIFLSGANIFLALIVWSELWRVWPQLRPGHAVGFCAAICMCAVISSLGSRWHQYYAKFYDVFYRTRMYSKLEREISANSRICPLMYRTYAFLGSRRQFEVLGPVWAPDYEALKSYLDAERPDWVVTNSGGVVGNRRYNLMRGWLEEHSELCTLVYSESQYHLFRLRSRDAESTVASSATSGAE